MPKDNLNDSGIGLDDSIISQDNESDIPYKIFYQSMEYPNTFTKKLASQLGVENGNSPKKGGKATDPKYYEKAESLLSEQFNMGADFVVLGEYYDPREIGTEAEGYRVVGKVGETTRAMTIYCTTKKEIPGARVTSLDGQKIDIQYIDKEYGESRGVNIEDSRKRLSEVSKSSTKHIGKFIELMIYNRYMLFVHVRDTGSKAQTNIANSFESGLPGIYVLAGDLNLGITGKNTHDIESPMGTHKFRANTNNLPNANPEDLELKAIHERANIPGKTSSAKTPTCHDGILEPKDGIPRTEYKPMGSIWHIVRDENVYKIMSDHKGFSTIMSITHRADSPTRSLTPTEEVVKKVIAGKKLKIKPKNQPAKNLAQEEPEDVVDLNHQEDSTTRSLIPTEDEEKEVIAAPKTNVQKIKPKIKPKNQPANDLAQEEPEDVVYLNHQEDSTTRSLTPTEEVVKVIAGKKLKIKPKNQPAKKLAQEEPTEKAGPDVGALEQTLEALTLETKDPFDLRAVGESLEL